MCKKLSTVLLIVISYCALHAQDFPKWEIGASGGPSGSFFFNQQPMKNPRNIHRPLYSSGMFGLGFQHNFTRMAALRVETNYERKGDIYYSIYGWEGGNAFRESYALDRVSYITLPVMARLSFGRNVRFFVNGGLYAAMQISSQRVVSDVSYTPVVDVVLRNQTTKTNIQNDIRTMDGGVVTGFGVFLPVGKRAAFTIEARNNTGFISQNNNTGLYQNKFYNNSTALLLGLTVAIDKPFPKLERKSKKAVKEMEEPMRY